MLLLNALTRRWTWRTVFSSLRAWGLCYGVSVCQQLWVGSRHLWCHNSYHLQTACSETLFMMYGIKKRGVGDFFPL